jgi:hypothetical protein
MDREGRRDVIDDTVGLTRRLVIEARRMTKQHERLGLLWTALLEPLANDDLDGARRPLEVLADGLRAHFSVEEDVEFPALHGGDPARTAKLQRIIEEHVAFRAALERMQALAAGNDLAGLAEAAADLAASMTDHEAREEALFKARS